MADLVTTQVLYDKDTESAFKFTDFSDSAGENNVIKIDASTLKNAANNGTERFEITSIWWDITATNKESINIEWSSSTENATTMILSGSGDWDLTESQMTLKNIANNATGDLQFTTNNFGNGSAYTIIVKIRKTAGYSYS